MSDDTFQKTLESKSSRLADAQNVLNSLDIDGNTKLTYNKKVSTLIEIEKSYIKQIVEYIRKNGLRNEEEQEMWDRVKNIILETYDFILTNMEHLIEESKRSIRIVPDITSDEALLNTMLKSISETGEIDKNLLRTIDDVRTASLLRYSASIIGDEKKASKKYPWLYYIPEVKSIDAILDEQNIDKYKYSEEEYENIRQENIKRIEEERKVDLIKEDGSSNEKLSHNFQVLLKQVYLITKLNVRNLNMLRMADIDGKNISLNVEKFNTFKEILGKLLFYKVSETYVSDSKSRDFRNLLESLYDRFISHVETEGDKMTIKTETFLKYLLIASKRINRDNILLYGNFIKETLDIVKDVIVANRNIASLDIIVSSTPGDINKDSLRFYHNSKNNIFTYVKIRSDDPDNVNNRFRVSLSGDNQIMYMGYDPTPEPIYDSYGILTEKFKYMEDATQQYPYNYLFGPFTYIFGTKKGNKEISEHSSMTPLLDKLIDGQSVCMIGYGASGSGKTTTLIYASFEKKEERRNGILLNFCDTLGSQNHYDSIELSFVELEADTSQKDEYLASLKYKKYPSMKYPSDRTKYYVNRNFKYEGNKWVLEKSKESQLQEFPEGTKMGDFIVKIMDNQRTVRATTNNPVSSRSHMIVFVKLRKRVNGGFEENQPYLVICDFAGVENKFDCSSPDVIDAFKLIKNTINCSDDQCRPFYDDYVNERVSDFRKQVDSISMDPQPGMPTRVVNNIDKLKKYTSHATIGALERLIKYIDERKNPKPAGSKKPDKQNRDLLVNKISGIQDFQTAFLQIWAGDITVGKLKEMNNTLFNVILGKKLSPTPKDYEDLIKSIKQVVKQMQWLLSGSEVESKKKAAEKKLINQMTEEYKTICRDRVKEGQFINDSLEQLRTFISYFLTIIQKKDNSIMNPKFIDSCVPIQCNPNYEDCFGSSLFSNKEDKEIERSSVIANQIRNKLCSYDDDSDNYGNCEAFSSMTFCIFNVINLSRRANNPPPIPYIDITNLMNEQNRLESISTMLVSDDVKISDDRTSFRVYKPYLEELLNSPLLVTQPMGTIKGDERNNIAILVRVLLDDYNKVLNSPDLTLTNLKNLISYINKINALTTVGTMEFTDMIAKFGLNRVTCGYRYKREQTQHSGSLSSATHIDGVNMKLDEYNQYLMDLKNLYNTSITTR